MEESPTKVESGDRKPGYKSWKKKYRKMRIVFDKKMQDGEDLHKQEAKACATAKRIAIENEYVESIAPNEDNDANLNPPVNCSSFSMKSTTHHRFPSTNA